MIRDRRRSFISVGLTIVALVCGGLSAGCKSDNGGRNPVPRELSATAEIPEIPLARLWGDVAPEFYEAWAASSEEELASRYAGIYGKEHHYLAISGGGPNGAFGAGFLCGWTASGGRPEFTMVTGVSAGALIAPFAFLGPEYDDELREAYTTYSTADYIEKRSLLGALLSDAAADTGPLQELIAKYVDDEMVEAIAVEFERGRKLLIGTTNLDADRPVIWSLGAIAASGHPSSIELIRKVLLASASIPAAFPPVYFDVVADGEVYDEMHVDGGATSQVFLYPSGVAWSEIASRLQVVGKPEVYVIRNAQLQPYWRSVEPGVIDIAKQSIKSLLKTQGIGDLYRIYATTQRDGMNFRVIDIPAEVDLEDKQEFIDREQMQALFDLGFELGESQDAWSGVPPGFETPDAEAGT